MADELSDKSGIVYILKNEAMPGIVKVGLTKDLKQRLLSLNDTNVPLPFECFYARRVDDMQFVEKRLFDAFADSRVSPRREFFRVLPERIKAALEIAPGKEVKVDESAIVQLPGDLESLEKAKARRPPFRFPMVGIMPGEELSFYNEPEIKSYVVDDKNVKFEDQIMSLGKAAGIVLTRMGKSDAVAGTDYWTKDGTTLWDLRNQAEESNND
jgi:hypothetical protein